MTKKIKEKIFHWLLLLFVFLLPWQIRFIYKDIMIDGQLWQYGRLSLYAGMLVLFLAALAFGSLHPDQWRLSQRKGWYILFLYSLFFCLVHPWPVLGLYYLLLFFATLLFIFLARQVSLSRILWATWASALVQSVLAIYQSLSQRIGAEKWLGISEQLTAHRGTSVLETATDRILRAYGSLPHPNMLAGFLALGILISLYLWQHIYQHGERYDWQLKKIKKYTPAICLLLFGLVLMTFAQLATFSRGAVLALLFSVLFILFFSLFKKDKLSSYISLKYLVLFAMVAIAFNMYYPALWSSRLAADNRLEKKSLQERQLSYGQLDWTDPKEIIFGQGFGLNTYWAYQKNMDGPVDKVQPIHNWFLLGLAEVGLLGMAILLALLYFYLREKLFAPNDYKIWPWTFLLLLFLLGLFDHYLWTSWTGWLMVGVVVTIIYKHQK